jgi:hypothetical protein
MYSLHFISVQRLSLAHPISSSGGGIWIVRRLQHSRVQARSPSAVSRLCNPSLRPWHQQRQRRLQPVIAMCQSQSQHIAHPVNSLVPNLLHQPCRQFPSHHLPIMLLTQWHVAHRLYQWKFLASPRRTHRVTQSPALLPSAPPPLIALQIHPLLLSLSILELL